MKHSYQTSEFWLTLVCHLVALVVVTTCHAQNSEQWDRVAAIVAAALVQRGYMHSRTVLKSGRNER